MRPLALTVVGGLSISMFLTLLVVPCLYLIGSGFAERAKTWLTGKNRIPGGNGADAAARTP
jgi:hypothetical protein